MGPSPESTVMIPNEGSSGDNDMSHCHQSSWVVYNTLKGNILFGREFDEEHYNLLTEVCALTYDW
jgi:hypothetical protein